MAMEESPITSGNPAVVADGDYIVLQRYGGYMRTHRISSKRPSASLGREVVDLTKVLGSEYGSAFKMCPDQSKKQGWILEPLAEAGEDFNEEEQEEQLLPEESGSDNRDLVDLTSSAASVAAPTSNSQGLTAAMIESLKGERVEGAEILGKLVENSSSFKSKTRYSQEKFIKKKARKYSQSVLVRKPSIRLLQQIHYRADPTKILNLRADSLALLLNAANLHGSDQADPRHFMIYESGGQGLVVAAALDRVMMTNGGRPEAEVTKIVQLYCTGNPQNQCIQAMNFGQDSLDRHLELLSLYHLRSLEQGVDITKDHHQHPIPEKTSQSPSVEEQQLSRDQQGGGGGEPPKKKPYRQILKEQSARSYEIMKATKASGLIVTCRHHPAEIVLTLLEYLGFSRPFAVFSPYKEPLIDTYFALKASGRAVMITLFETWLRNYQVLPARTHPEVLMSGGGGYILTGMSVDPAAGDAGTDVQQASEQASSSTANGDNSARKGRKVKRFRRR